MMIIRQNNPAKPALVITGIVVAAAIIYGATAYFTHLWPFSNTAAANNPDTISSQSAIDQHKTSFSEQQSQLQQNNTSSNDSSTSTSDDSTTKQPATVIVTDAAQYGNTVEVRSYISDRYENGTCTITLTQGSASVVKQTPAYTDASTTICTNPLITRSEFKSAGDWSLQVTFESAHYKGTSAAQKVTLK